MNTTTHSVVVPFPQAAGFSCEKLVSLCPKVRSKQSSTLAEHPTGCEASMRSLARFYAGCSALFLG